MFEAVLLVVLVGGVVWAIRGKPSAPLVIHQSGCFHATLAPSRSHLQGLIESVVSQFFASGEKAHELQTQYFELSGGTERTLLAVALRDNLLYFQAIVPHGTVSSYQLLSEFSAQVMVHHPLRGASESCSEQALQAIVVAAAARFNLACKYIIH